MFYNQTLFSDIKHKEIKMSEIINNSKVRVENIKKALLELHNGISVEETRKKLSRLMEAAPYGEVVQAEQELIAEGIPVQDILKYCDLHSDALKGKIENTRVQNLPADHPVETFVKENVALQSVIASIKNSFNNVNLIKETTIPADMLLSIRSEFNSLMDIEKHYVRKENLVFPFLEKYQITGPPMVMWGKHDEVRQFLKSAQQIFSEIRVVTKTEFEGIIELALSPALKAIEEMIYKEEQILFPMCLDTFTEINWYDIYLQSQSIGYCLYAPTAEWKPDASVVNAAKPADNSKIELSTGSFSKEELEALFTSLPLDLTFVDKDDNVRYFSHGKERIFERSKAILGRKVQFCHPPTSVHIVEKILNDFKSGAQDSAKFWIPFKGKFVHIAYYAVRNEAKEYLGTLEVTQDIAPLKAIEGERRLLSYDDK
jgi:DUF438 domain-containing protein